MIIPWTVLLLTHAAFAKLHIHAKVKITFPNNTGSLQPQVSVKDVKVDKQPATQNVAQETGKQQPAVTQVQPTAKQAADNKASNSGTPVQNDNQQAQQGNPAPSGAENGKQASVTSSKAIAHIEKKLKTEVRKLVKEMQKKHEDKELGSVEVAAIMAEKSFADATHQYDRCKAKEDKTKKDLGCCKFLRVWPAIRRQDRLETLQDKFEAALKNLEDWVVNKRAHLAKKKHEWKDKYLKKALHVTDEEYDKKHSEVEERFREKIQRIESRFKLQKELVRLCKKPSSKKKLSSMKVSELLRALKSESAENDASSDDQPNQQQADKGGSGETDESDEAISVSSETIEKAVKKGLSLI